MPHVGWPGRNIEWHGAGENLLDDAIYGLLARDSLSSIGRNSSTSRAATETAFL